MPSRQVLLAAPVRWPRPSALAAAPHLTYDKAREAAQSLGLTTVGALLEHLPRDRREARTVADLGPGEMATVVVEVRSIVSRPVRRRGMKPLVEATVADETGPMKVVFFNQPWLAGKYPPGTRLVLHGKYEARNRFKVSSHAPTLEATASGEAVAHYPATEGLSSTQILALVREHLGAADDAPEPCRAGCAWRRVCPTGLPPCARRTSATPRAVVVALPSTSCCYTARLPDARRGREQAASALALGEDPSLSARWLTELLPFAPTGDQSAAIATITGDLARDRPMQRLLMGEVGSGKTVVALYAMLRAVEHGTQAALMAPTETLAEQHFATVQSLMGAWAGSVTIALLTGSTPAARKRDILGKLASGELSMVVGTHALIEEPVIFDRLSVAVVDEQHRFGVRQRAALDAKAGVGADGRLMAPHVLHMTATPIPRTLALLGYGDLDVTVLKELPKGRRPIVTHVAGGDRERTRAYERIREELDAGRQAFVVCPLVAESEALAARAAIQEFERLRDGELREYRVTLLHGQMRPQEKRDAMEAFARHESDVLVATTVIEVGIDVPNATVMLVENAERYGISQLHQLRGRVGRGEHDSLCLLFGPKDSPRLSALAEHRDGFLLAEIDLELRGEGELIGTRQSGLATFRVAELPMDAPILDRARDVAEALMATDPDLLAPEHVLLADALRAAHPQLDAMPIPA